MGGGGAIVEAPRSSSGCALWKRGGCVMRANGQVGQPMFARDLASGPGKPAQPGFRELTLAAFGQK